MKRARHTLQPTAARRKRAIHYRKLKAFLFGVALLLCITLGAQETRGAPLNLLQRRAELKVQRPARPVLLLDQSVSVTSQITAVSKRRSHPERCVASTIVALKGLMITQTRSLASFFMSMRGSAPDLEQHMKIVTQLRNNGTTCVTDQSGNYQLGAPEYANSDAHSLPKHRVDIMSTEGKPRSTEQHRRDSADGLEVREGSTTVPTNCGDATHHQRETSALSSSNDWIQALLMKRLVGSVINNVPENKKGKKTNSTMSTQGTSGYDNGDHPPRSRRGFDQHTASPATKRTKYLSRRKFSTLFAFKKWSQARRSKRDVASLFYRLTGSKPGQKPSNTTPKDKNGDKRVPGYGNGDMHPQYARSIMKSVGLPLDRLERLAKRIVTTVSRNNTKHEPGHTKSGNTRHGGLGGTRDYGNGDWSQPAIKRSLIERADSPPNSTANPFNLGQQCQSLISSYDGSWYNNGDMILQTIENDKSADSETLCQCLNNELAEARKAGTDGPKRTSKCLKQKTREPSAPHR